MRCRQKKIYYIHTYMIYVCTYICSMIIYECYDEWWWCFCKLNTLFELNCDINTIYEDITRDIICTTNCFSEINEYMMILECFLKNLRTKQISQEKLLWFYDIQYLVRDYFLNQKAFFFRLFSSWKFDTLDNICHLQLHILF